MATIANNPLTDGLSGMLGKNFVFKNYRKKTIVAAYSPPSKKQSEAQRANRSKFKDAAKWAQNVLQNPERKTYYNQRAKKLGLPNAYTAAITDYMRKPRVIEMGKRDGVTNYVIDKKSFRITAVEMHIAQADGTTTSCVVNATPMGVCRISLPDSGLGQETQIIVHDETGQSCSM